MTTTTLVCREREEGRERGGLRIYESADRRGNKGNTRGIFAHFIFFDLTEDSLRCAYFHPCVRYRKNFNCGCQAGALGIKALGLREINRVGFMEGG